MDIIYCSNGIHLNSSSYIITVDQSSSSPGPQAYKRTSTIPTAWTKYEYQQRVASLLWLSSSTRFDLSYVNYYLSHFTSKTRKQHEAILQHAIRYLFGSRKLGLVYQK
ncbi:uncharacterized protein RJT21DRAFT_6534 [Scheffersomyces amazonensis]|uniref:uncharacterized protein n=1 Tax=Scheffersomyces amazonensis TaxID=1078765 RepID=UPI00315DB7D9